MWHACGDYSVERFLDGKGPRARALFARFAALVRRCGPVTVAPAKTRIAFMVRVRFASVSRVSERGMTCAFGLRRRLENPRIARVEQIEKWFVHTLRVASPDELDDEVLEWLREAYAVGEQRTPGDAGDAGDADGLDQQPSAEDLIRSAGLPWVGPRSRSG
jgi:hypothetical protein